MNFWPSAFGQDHLYLTWGDLLRLVRHGTLKRGALEVYLWRKPEKPRQ